MKCQIYTWWENAAQCYCANFQEGMDLLEEVQKVTELFKNGLILEEEFRLRIACISSSMLPYF